jgi:hypothetical protein
MPSGRFRNPLQSVQQPFRIGPWHDRQLFEYRWRD